MKRRVWFSSTTTSGSSRASLTPNGNFAAAACISRDGACVCVFSKCAHATCAVMATLSQDTIGDFHSQSTILIRDCDSLACRTSSHREVRARVAHRSTDGPGTWDSRHSKPSASRRYKLPLRVLEPHERATVSVTPVAWSIYIALHVAFWSEDSSAAGSVKRAEV